MWYIWPTLSLVNWSVAQTGTFSLVNRVILSVHCFMMLHNTRYCSIIIDGNYCLPQDGKADNCSLSLHSPKCHHANHVTKYCDSKHSVHLTHNKNSFSQKYIRCLGIYFTMISSSWSGAYTMLTLRRTRTVSFHYWCEHTEHLHK